MDKATEYVQEQTALVSDVLRAAQESVAETQQQLTQMQTQIQSANDAVLEAIDLLKEELAEDF
jgi:uncharacterized protein YqgV (UPF0045/DUF77 family)